MRRVGRFSLPLVLVLALSGCTGLMDSEASTASIAVPGLRYGDEWAYAIGETNTPKKGSGPVVRVGEGPETILDRYGNPVQAVRLETYWRGLPPEWATSILWLDLASGNRLAADGADNQYPGKCYFSGLPTQGSQSMQYAQTHDAAHYMRAPVRHDFQNAWGKTFEQGKTLTEAAEVGEPWFSASMSTKYTLINAFSIQPLVAAGMSMEAVVVEQTTVGHYLGLGMDDEFRRTVQWYLNAAFPVPMRVQELTDEGKARLFLELESYKPGSKPIAFGRQSTASFAPTNPDSRSAAARPTPPMGGLHLEFSFGAALEAVKTDPRNPQAGLWLLQHPAAFAERATYTRDRDARVYRWSMTLRDGSELLYANAERKIVAGLPVDAGSGGQPYQPSRGPQEPMGPVTDLASALRVATAFDPALKDWARLEWAPGHGFHHDAPPSLSYSFATATKHSAAGPAPFTQTEVVTYQNGPSVDGASGGRDSGSIHVGGACQSGLVVRPPF